MDLKGEKLVFSSTKQLLKLANERKKVTTSSTMPDTPECRNLITLDSKSTATYNKQQNIYLQAEHPVSLLSVLLVLHPKWKRWFSLWIFPLVTKQILYVVRIRDCNRVKIKNFLSINLPILLGSILLNLMYSCVTFATDVVE